MTFQHRRRPYAIEYKVGGKWHRPMTRYRILDNAADAARETLTRPSVSCVRVVNIHALVDDPKRVKFFRAKIAVEGTVL